MRSPARLSCLLPTLFAACAGMGGPPQSAYQIPPNMRPQPFLRTPPSLELARSRTYTSGRATSADQAGPNAGSRPVKAGAEQVLCELAGPGVITHVWITLPAFADGVLRRLVLKAFWDGSETAAILSPLGDFFGVPHGGDRQHAYSNAYFDWSPQWGLHCHLPMPFRKSARLVVANEGAQDSGALHYAVDHVRVEGLPDDALYLCASYRQAFPATVGEDFVFAEGKGKGHLLGVNLGVETTRDGWWGAGVDRIEIDGKPLASGAGTGGYFGGAGNSGAEHAALWSGSPRLEEAKQGGRHLVYRFHGNDPIPFRQAFSYRCQHGRDNDRADNWSSVAYWYQALPHAPLPPLPYYSRNAATSRCRRCRTSSRFFWSSVV